MDNNGVMNEVTIFGLNGVKQVSDINISPNSGFTQAFNATSGVLTLSDMTLTIYKEFTITFSTS